MLFVKGQIFSVNVYHGSYKNYYEEPRKIPLSGCKHVKIFLQSYNLQADFLSILDAKYNVYEKAIRVG